MILTEVTGMDEVRYSVQQLAELADVSTRTLHHYDRIGLLVPRRQKNGYRYYTSRDVERLQQILLYRACGMSLGAIAHTLDDASFDVEAALEEQLACLRRQADDLAALIHTVEQTLALHREGTKMADSARFEGFKRKAVEDNERTYGREARRRHGDAAVDAANAALLAMDEKTWNDMNALEEKIKELLAAAMREGDATGPAAKELVHAHARWLQLHWGERAYNAEAHRGLADGYLADERFVAYYDGACGEGATQFLHDAIWALV